MPIATYKRVSDKVGLLQLDDGQANAFGTQMLKEASECLIVAEKDLLGCHGALVIAGNQRLLSSGFDLKVMMKGPKEAQALIAAGAAFIERLALFPRPVVVAATGHAVALGALVLLTGDYRIGPSTVGGKPLKVGLNETSNGMRMPDFFAEGARYTLAPQYLRECLALGLIYDADRAQVVGFLDEVVAEGKVLQAARAKAEELAAWCKHPAFIENKKLVRRPLDEVIARGRAEQKPTESLTWFAKQPSKL
mmetsp:Transcript_48736/g.123606  ORF Transcript_48736/g.123606 Transcript_48736/m.123606 type:complete len:250 (-) Transcript_48736:198-947(-)|eukprot:CAMPEP_0183399058 /NCGR_PEP_ID=MMETSP0370-20130417/11675_1 /TAXON_ID=268820 /ORGANISM="Peridinium aciculiferum, Strain PAER-2" /LENGTH=249 /DNA_ID=CAMNT_0025580159 /DNA_START=47 /DNA_END=796 /DNA_ORIENTATION=+